MEVHRVAVMVQMRLTRSPFLCAGLEVSHLCQMKLCINPMHLTLEFNATKQERIHCVMQRCCCGSACSKVIILIFNLSNMKLLNHLIWNKYVQVVFLSCLGLEIQVT